MLTGSEIPLITYSPQTKPRYFYKNSYCSIIFVKAKQTKKQTKNLGNDLQVYLKTIG